MKYAMTFLVYLSLLLPAHFYDSKHIDNKGSFELINGELKTEINFSNAGNNHVFAKRYDDYLWLRFAASPEKDGETSDHLDIDIWNYSGPGTYEAADPKNDKREGNRWNIWWHKDGSAFVNQADSKPCQLILELEDNQLLGSFSCTGLKRSDGSELLDVANGSFKVTPVDGASD